MKNPMDNINIDDLIEIYTGIGTSTIGHLTAEGYLADVKALNACSQTIVGRILTVSLRSDNTDVIKQALVQAKPKDILCIDARILGIKACWGALRTCAAIYEKLAAVIVIGQVTDSAQIQQLNFPVFATGVSAVTTFKSSQAPGALDTNICYQYQEQTTTVRSGDLAVMDNDGVFILHTDLAYELSSACQTKHREDDTKFQLFFDAYRTNKLDQLFDQQR